MAAALKEQTSRFAQLEWDRERDREEARVNRQRDLHFAQAQRAEDIAAAALQRDWDLDEADRLRTRDREATRAQELQFQNDSLLQSNHEIRQDFLSSMSQLMRSGQAPSTSPTPHSPRLLEPPQLTAPTSQARFSHRQEDLDGNHP
jgi:hypothetical protein